MIPINANKKPKMEKRIENLIKFSQNMYHNENVKELYDKYLIDIQQVTPMDVFEIENEQLKLGVSPKEMVGFVVTEGHMKHAFPLLRELPASL
jgi:hypothetical protein